MGDVPIEAATSTRCVRCGTDLPPESRFCLHCGKRVVRRSDSLVAFPERLQRALGEDYEVRNEIGRGGFGVVYLVHDLRLDRRLAVKVIRPEFVASDVIVARFRREAKIVAALNHDNVVGITFAGEGEGIVYCAMPLIVGDTLRERQKNVGTFSVDKALRVFGEVAQGLAHAHARNIVHRDVKPANIMLDHDGGDRAVLLDFGIAQGLSVGGGKMSISGQIIGSPEYMSPERKAGARSLDGKSDIYSMGVVAFEMLTASLPFATDPASNKATVRAIPDVRTVRRDIPENFAEAISRCMQHLPAERPTAREAALAAGAPFAEA